MKYRIQGKSSLVIAAALFLTIAFSVRSLSEKKKHTYVGSAVCGTCHDAESIGNQYDRWRRSPHAKAVLILTTAPALDLAKKLSIASPGKDRACLVCHTTGGGKHRNTIDEGVGCEACHGPGSGYAEFAGHVDMVDRLGAYNTALKNGMYPVLGIKHIKKREKVCLRCHNGRRPCFPTDPKEIYRQSISLQVITDLKKGDLVLEHKLIPPFPQY